MICTALLIHKGEGEDDGDGDSVVLVVIILVGATGVSVVIEVLVGVIIVSLSVEIVAGGHYYPLYILYILCCYNILLFILTEYYITKI